MLTISSFEPTAHTAVSPELVAKLGHDYTVYAYDYSEYETPLVGQGMLSWILASASATPNAPAEQSQTMVTGRVCKNILGLFSNGVKETLEVKLKLVPVPTCMQSEYVENMERYHNLSKIMPDGPPDYNAWAEFLKANPAIRQLAQPTPVSLDPAPDQTFMGGVESFHEMLSRPNSAADMLRNDSFYDQHRVSFSAHDTRASSPAMSTTSFYPNQFYQDSRPTSRASFRDEGANQSQYYTQANPGQDLQEEGPPKKRARITKAKRPKNSALNVNHESLRVTASTAASVRLHKPANSSGTATLSTDQIPRAPTPRPGDVAMPLARNALRPPAPSLLRHASMDDSRPYISPYESGLLSDIAVESPEDDRGCSPADTPHNIPSSPPVLPQRMASSAPSSPDLPSLPIPNDSGFVSDMPTGRDEEEVAGTAKSWGGDSAAPVPDVRMRARPDNSKRPWNEVNPGSVELLPKSYVPKPKPMPPGRWRRGQQATDTAPMGPNAQIDEDVLRCFQDQLEGAGSATIHHTDSNIGRHRDHEIRKLSTTTLPPMDTVPFDQLPQESFLEPSPQPDTSTALPGSTLPQPTGTIAGSTVTSRAGTPNPLPQPSGPSKSRGLPRSHTWSGELNSDGPAPPESNTKQPRSGSGAKRRHRIREKLDKALDAGEMPTYCNNCGQIDTPVWRKAFTRIEDGSPPEVQTSSKGTGLPAYEILEPAEKEGAPQYRIVKQALDPEEIEGGTFTTLTLCNPCGLWLAKKSAMRPPEMWTKSQATNDAEKPKRKRNRKKAKGEHDDMFSDAVVPTSEPVIPDRPEEAEVIASSSRDGSADAADSEKEPASRKRSSSFRFAQGARIDEATAQAALIRAIHSSPVGLRGAKDSPIEIEADLTPKPTRRLLFPSPRKPGEVKSLADNRSSQSLKCTSEKADPKIIFPEVDVEDTDKENCPPSAATQDDGLSHLFDDPVSPKTTPTKNRPFEDLLKTPTPGSRRRNPLTPKRGSEFTGPTTPSRICKTPRSGRAATIAPETPFTRQLNALLSDCMPGSPSRIDFSAFPTFNTPGRDHSSAQFSYSLPDDFLSSDLPMPSSPPPGLNFSVFEDPSTSTAGLWSGASIFEGSDTLLPDGPLTDGPTGENDEDEKKGDSEGRFLKISAIGVDFAAMIEGVVGSVEKTTGTNGGQGQDGQAGKAVDGAVVAETQDSREKKGE